jgi:glutathione S-transferase
LFDSQETFMKFYDWVTAPSPRRVRIFLAEKGLTVPTVQVDLRNGEQFNPAFRALNSIASRRLTAFSQARAILPAREHKSDV